MWSVLGWLMWSLYPYSSGLLHWPWHNCMIDPMHNQVILMDVGEIFHKPTTTKHNKAQTMCLFPGMYYSLLGLSELTHCPLRDVEMNLKIRFSDSFYRIVGWASDVKLFSGDWRRTLLMISQHWSGNGLVPSGNKPLPEPMLTQIYVAIWRH